MLNRLKYLLLLLLVSTLTSCSNKENEIDTKIKDLIHWRSEWNDKVFEDATKENKLVLLNLEARWCHWCHVMKAETYQDTNIANLLNEKFIAVRIDQDDNAYLSNRYKDYGWPATIILDASGAEIVKRAGYIEPESMLKLLQAVIENPSPEQEFSRAIEYSTTSNLNDDLKAKLIANYFASLDLEKGGLAIQQKYIDRDTLEYSLYLAHKSQDPKEAELAKNYSLLTLKQAILIMDKVWGGFYQYSTHEDWYKPHYEKLAEVQAEYLKIYSLAQLQYPNPEFLKIIKATVKYLDSFLTEKFTGRFYSSQDADLIAGKKASDYFALNDRERRAKGIPIVDKNIFASKNGKIIEALVYAYKASADKSYLDKAIKAAKSINKTHRKKDYSYSHSLKDTSSYLSDNLFMAKAELALYEASAELVWLKSSIATAKYIIKNYRAEQPGYLSNNFQDRAKTSKLNQALKPVPVLDENIKLARFFNLLYHYSGDIQFKNEAKYIMQYLASRDIALDSISEPAILIADLELAEDPVHFTVVGAKNNSKSKQLFNAVQQYPYSSYIRVEWWDPKGTKLMNQDVEYPSELPRPAVFSCANHACSLPIFEVADLKSSF